MTEIHIERQLPPDAIQTQPEPALYAQQPQGSEPVVGQAPAITLSRTHVNALAQDDTLLKAKEQSRARAEQLDQARAAERRGELPQDLQKVDRCREAEITLPDGRVIWMAPPPIATEILKEKILQERMFADEKMMGLAGLYVHAVLHICTIDGVTFSRPVNAVEYQSAAQKLGDAGMEAVFHAYLECFPPIQRSELKIVKKY